MMKPGFFIAAGLALLLSSGSLSRIALSNPIISSTDFMPPDLPTQSDDSPPPDSDPETGLLETPTSSLLITNVVTSKALKDSDLILTSQTYPEDADADNQNAWLFSSNSTSDDPGQLQLTSDSGKHVIIAHDFETNGTESDVLPAALIENSTSGWNYSYYGSDVAFRDPYGYYLCAFSPTFPSIIIGNRRFSDLCKFRLRKLVSKLVPAKVKDLFTYWWTITNIVTSNALKAYNFALKNQKLPPKSTNYDEKAKFAFYLKRISEDPSQVKIHSTDNNYITLVDDPNTNDQGSGIKLAGLTTNDSYIWSYSVNGSEFVFSDMDGYYLCSTNSTTVKQIIGNKEFSDLCKFRLEIAGFIPSNFGGSIYFKQRWG